MFKFFKSKRDFDKAVEAEVERRELERKQKAQEMREWIEENPLEVRLTEKAEIQQRYIEAEEMFKAGNPEDAFVKLTEVINRSALLSGEVIGLYVFVLLVDVKKALSGKEGALEAYDEGISYYSSVQGDYVSGWLEHLKVSRESYLKEEELMERMRERYKFPLAEDVVIALKRLEGLAVYRYLYDEMDSFDAVWRAVLKQVDYFEQGEKGWNNLNKTTYKGAKNWLKSFAHLCSDAVPDEYRRE